MSILEEFGEHMCEVCGTDCIEVEAQISAKDKRIAAAEAQVADLHAQMVVVKEQWGVCLDGWKTANELRKELQAQIDALRSENQRLRAPSTPMEREECVAFRDGLDTVIRARAEAPQEKP